LGNVPIYCKFLVPFYDLNLSSYFTAFKIRCLEDIFKLAKKADSMENLHRYTRRFVQKFCSLAVLLVFMTIILGINEKKTIQTGYE